MEKRGSFAGSAAAREGRFAHIPHMFLMPACVVFFVGVLAGLPASSTATSFDCSKSSNDVERAICGDKKLSDLDDQLAAAYKKALAQTKDKAALKERQRTWLQSERDRCGDNACIEAAYVKRLAELQGGTATAAAAGSAGTGDASASSAPSSAASPAQSGLPPKTGLTMEDRERWYKIIKWPAECEESFQKVSGSDSEPGVDFYKLADTKYLVQVQCYLGAYQSGYVFMLYDEKASTARLLKFKCYDRQRNGSVTVTEETRIAGFPEFDEKTKTLKMFTKARGIGDCGSLVTYKFDSGSPVVVEARAQGCLDDIERMIDDAAKWPKVEKP